MKRQYIQYKLGSKTNDQGFVLPIMLGVGMIMSVAATSMIIQAASQETQTSTQEVINQGSAHTDVAVKRIIYFLNQHRELVNKPTDQWETIANEIMAESTTGGSNDLEGITCDESEEVNQTMLNNLLAKTWISMDRNNPSAGDYRLLQYQLDSVDNPRTAKLQIEARAVQDSNTKLSVRNSVKALEVVVAIGQQSGTLAPELPGLWISDTTGGTGGLATNSKQSSGANKPINAVTWIDCSQTIDWDTNTAYVNDTKIDTTAIATDGGSMNPPAEVKQVEDDLPSVPSIPVGAYDLGSLNASNCYITLPRTDGNTWGGNTASGCDTINDRTSDESIDGVYHYHFTDVTLSNSQIRIKPPEGTKVVIHVSRGITMSGTGVSHGAATSCVGTSEAVTTYIGDPDDPSKLELYSHATSPLDPIDISDTTMISGFVHAPNTELKISQGQVRGAAWVKSMDASNSGGGYGCDRSIKQMDIGKIEILGGDEGKPKPYLGQVLSYRTTEAN